MNIKNWFRSDSAPTITETNISFGNWRDRSSWSEIARSTFHDRRLLSEPESPINQSIADPVRKLYGITHQYLAIRMANNLFDDIYEPALHPSHIADNMKKDPAATKIYGRDIARVISEFGGYGVIYADNSLDSALPEESYIMKGGFAFLVPESGMPLKDFLLWYKGPTSSVHPDVMPEWSGVPREELLNVYEALLIFLRNEIKHEYPREIRRRSTDIGAST